MRCITLIALIAISCRGAQGPEGEEPASPRHTEALPTSDSPMTPPADASDSTATSGPLQARDVSCHEPDLSAFRGTVEQQGTTFVLRSGGRDIPLWEISQQEAVAPRSPDLSGLVGQEVVICGTYDGSALYRARPASQAARQ